MRLVKFNEHTEVYSIDEPGVGGANHLYVVCNTVGDAKQDQTRLSTISFQKGPIQESGVNGCQNEDLLAIVIDRLRGFQSGEFSCRENALALTKLEESLHWLNHRTEDRRRRGVEGKSVV